MMIFKRRATSSAEMLENVAFWVYMAWKIRSASVDHPAIINEK
jgi:hypothetical protein